MPFESKYSKESIIEAAFDIAKEEGLAAVTARTVAKKINGSVAPIYFNFENIEALVKAVVYKIFALTQEILAEQTGDSLYENMGRAGFVFASRYPVFFRDLVLTPNPYMASYAQTETAMLQNFDHDPKLYKLSMKERRILILKVKALQIGFQTLIATNHIPDWMTEDEMKELFISMGNDLLALALSNKVFEEGGEQ